MGQMKALAIAIMEEEAFLERTLNDREREAITERHIAYSKDRLPDLAPTKEEYEKDFGSFLDKLNKDNQPKTEQ